MRNARVLISAVFVATAFSAPLPAWGQCDPVGLIDALIVEVDGISEELEPARDKLVGAQEKLAEEKVDDAVVLVTDFIDQISDAVPDEISQETADELIELAQIIIEIINLPDCVNDGSPVAVDDTYDALKDIPLSVDADSGVLVNDFDPDLNLPLTVLSHDATSASGGTVVVFTDGGFDYTPPALFVGDDTFTYFVQDDDMVPSAAAGTVTITVVAATSDVVAFDDAYHTAANSSLVVSAASGLLLNDINVVDPAPNPPFNDELTVDSIDDTGLVGAVTVNPDGSIVYTPPVGVLSLVDTFTYIVENASLVQDTATVTITVFSEPLPAAIDDAYSVADLSGGLTIDADGGLLSNDEGLVPLTVTSVDTTATLGTVVTFSADGSFEYDPPAGFTGIDTFTYLMQDKDFVPGASPGTVTLAVFAVPIAVDDEFSIGGNTSLVVGAAAGLLDNDTDSDDPDPNPPFNDELTIASFDAVTAQGGTVAVNLNGGFTYTAPVGTALASTDTFNYFAQDASGLVSLDDPAGSGIGATVTITNINNTPTAANVATAATEGAPAINDFFAADDADGDDSPSSLIYAIVTPPSEGSASLGVTNDTFDFDPGTDFVDLAFGETRDASFDYQATDSHGAVSSTATVTVTVTGIDLAPIAQNVGLGVVPPAPAVAGATAGGGGVAAAVVGEIITACFDADDPDSDDDPSTLIYEIVAQPLEGTVTLGTIFGTFKYDPEGATGAPRNVSFDYKASSGLGGPSDIGTVTIGIALPAGTGTWYVDNNVAGPGTGTQADPFNSLAPVNGAGGFGDVDGPGDKIVVIGGGADYDPGDGGLEMEDNQELSGESGPTITNPDGDGIVLARCNFVHGVTVDNTGAAGIAGDLVGVATIDNVAILSTGVEAIRLKDTAHAVTITDSTIQGHPNGAGIRVLNANTSMGRDVRIGVDDDGMAAGNTFSELAGAHPHAAIHIEAIGAGHVLTALVQNNSIDDQGDFVVGSGGGVLVEAGEEANIDATITDNAITDRAGDNIGVHASTGALISVLIENNTLTGSPTGSGARESAIQVATLGESTGSMRVANIDIVNGIGVLPIVNTITGFTGTGVHEPIKIIAPSGFCSELSDCNFGTCVGEGVCDCGVDVPCANVSCNADCSECFAVSACPPSIGTCAAQTGGCDPLTGDCELTLAGTPCDTTDGNVFCTTCDGECDGGGCASPVHNVP